MKIYLTSIFFLAFIFQAMGQASPLLYPKIYEVITIDKQAKVEMAQLELLSIQEQYELIVEEFELKLIKAHPPHISTEKQAVYVREIMEANLGLDGNSIHTKYYGWEYLPSAYKNTILRIEKNAPN